MLPVLGAVPDGAIVLFSGMGENAPTQIVVGVGALAGSTIMLLTIPWVLATYSGRVDMPETSLEDDIGGYKKRSFERLSEKNKMSLKNSGTMPFASIKQGS